MIFPLMNKYPELKGCADLSNVWLKIHEVGQEVHYTYWDGLCPETPSSTKVYSKKKNESLIQFEERHEKAILNVLIKIHCGQNSVSG